MTRLRQRYDLRNPGRALAGRILMELGDFPMMRRMLLGIKKRAEQHGRPGTRERADSTILHGAM